MLEEIELSLVPGDELHGFILEAVDVLDDYHGYGYFFRHRITGMEVYHVANNDIENFFSFIFKTPPNNDCGTPHIIEHCVLAGSKRYPIRDPFMSLLKGSANTFMNAMTYPDYTVYPAASPLPKDFNHLFAVYADAVFNPLLREETFWQEGVRLTADSTGKLKFDGVVYNEMLGALSDHDAIVGRNSIRSLYPDTPYFYESGGDPNHIITLDYRQFAGYYASHYHPSNCRLFVYGNQGIAERLALLDDLYLADHSAITRIGSTPLAKTWTKAKTVSVTSPSEDAATDAHDASVAISWATTLAEEPLEVLTLSILTDILLGNPGAPLYKAIIDSRLAKDISQVSGMDTSFRQMPFTVGFKGIDPQQAEVAQQLILDTLTNIVEEGIPNQLVLNAVKRQEFLLQELTGDVPMGLRAMSRAVRGWLQGLKPHVTIGISKPLETLKQLIEESTLQTGDLFAKRETKTGSYGYFEHWITENLLENPHRCLLIVKPDLAFNTQLEASINQRLTDIQERLGKDGLAKLQADTERFHQFELQRDTPEALRTIPRLTKSDLPETIRTLPQTLKNASGVPLYLQPMEANGIIYTDGLFTVGDLTEEEQFLLPLLTRLLHMTGVGSYSYAEMAVRIREKTGGLFFFIESSSFLQTSSSSLSALAFRLKSLERDHNQALELLSSILRQANVDDPERIYAVLNDLISDYESNVTSAGQMYAAQRAAAQFSPVLQQSEIWNGITQWFFLVGHDPTKSETIEKLGTALRTLRDKIIDRSRLTLHVCTSESLLPMAERQLWDFAATFKSAGDIILTTQTNYTSFDPTSKESLELFRIPSSVSFSALVCKAAEPIDPRQAHQAILGHILTTNHLWEQVRGVGGAYGVSAHIDMLERLCIFSSYRDPRVEGTLNDFKDVLKRVAKEGLDEELVDLAIISIISRELRPLYPKNAAMTAFRRALYGISDTFRIERRSWILETTVEDVQQAAQDLLLSMETYTSAVVIAGQEILEREALQSERLRQETIKLPV
ncbi:MAG: insulinase family protein [Sphaerochaetaceae bacterium]